MNKPKLNQPDVEITTTIGAFSNPISNYIDTMVTTDKPITAVTIEPTLEEIKQEWVDNGFEIISCSKKRFEVYKNWIKKGSHTYAKVVIDDYLYIVGEFSNKYIQLLNKTFRALGVV